MRFDVYRNAGEHAGSMPYLVDVQSNLLDELESRVVVPLRLLDHFAAAKIPTLLTPIFAVEGRDCLLETPKLAAVPRRLLKKVVTSLESDHGRIVGALDFLFQGY